MAHWRFELVDGGLLVSLDGLSDSSLAWARMVVPETRMAPRTISTRSALSRNTCFVWAQADALGAVAARAGGLFAARASG